MIDVSSRQQWKGPTIQEISRVAGVGSATVDRVLNNRPGVREKTRLKVLAALDKLGQDIANNLLTLHVRLFCDSGETFNATLSDAASELNATVPGVIMSGHYISTDKVDPLAFADHVQVAGVDSDGVIVISREHPAINRAIRRLRERGIPVVCLTTDLPNSGRSIYIGNDQYAAGSVAGILIGNSLPKSAAKVLLISSVPFRCQQEREMGFRRVLRSDFPHLKIDKKVLSDDRPQTTAERLQHYYSKHGLPAAIYNVAGANRGVAQSLVAIPQDVRTLFVGHELTVHTRQMLEGCVMDYVISHDFLIELTKAVRWIRDLRSGIVGTPEHSKILVHTRYN